MKQQLTARAQHSVQLAQRSRLVVDAAQHEGRDDDVEAGVLEGKVLGRSAQHRRLRRLLLRPLHEPA